MESSVAGPRSHSDDAGTSFHCCLTLGRTCRQLRNGDKGRARGRVGLPALQKGCLKVTEYRKPSETSCAILGLCLLPPTQYSPLLLGTEEKGSQAFEPTWHRWRWGRRIRCLVALLESPQSSTCDTCTQNRLVTFRNRCLLLRGGSVFTPRTPGKL